MDGEYLVCRSDDCPAQTAGAIRRWIKKVGVLDWGNASIEALCESGLVNDPADLYTLTIAQIAATEMGGRKIGFTTATTMLNNLKDKMELPLHVFVGSLGIPICSRSVCKMIVDAGYNDLDKMNGATIAQLERVPGIGTTKAQAFVTGFRAKVGLISKLMTNGVKIKAASTGKLQGKTFCMTGFRDARLAAAIEQLGGVIKSSVVKGLDYLIVVDLNTDSSKAQKARQQGTKCIEVDEAWAMTR
jgi:DNA ligase (NAD+)